MANIEIIDLEEQKKQELEGSGTALLEDAKALTVNTDDGKVILRSVEEKEKAGKILKDVSALEKQIKEHYSPMKKKADEMKKSILDAEKESLAIPSQVKTLLSNAIGEFEKKEREEAAKKEREERKRLEKIRLEEAEKKQKEADTLKAQGKTEEAAQMQEEAEAIIDQPEPEIKIQTSGKISGTKTVEYWKFETIDSEKIKNEIADLFSNARERVLFLLSFLRNDDVLIGAHVKTQKEKAIGKLPGIRVFSESKTSSTGR